MSFFENIKSQQGINAAFPHHHQLLLYENLKTIYKKINEVGKRKREI
jgi:hypothetical protein